MTTSVDTFPLNFLTFKSNGRTYIRAYRNTWVPKQVDEAGNVVKKAGSAPAEQHHVGVLLPNGKVKVSKKFIEKFPIFAGQDWYYLDRQLVDEDTFFAKTPDPIEVATKGIEVESVEEEDVQEEDVEPRFSGPEVKNFLPYYALASLAQKTGIVDALTDTFGKEAAMCWRDLAIYQVLDSGSADCFEFWAEEQYLPNVSSKMDGRVISKLLRTCSEQAWDKFWRERYEQAQKATVATTGERAIRFCAFDSTSISTYSESELAAYGHAKQDADLPQINLATIVDQFTGDLVYAFAYEGSINDKSTYTYIYQRMESVGFPMQEIMLITDRGYYSTFNANEMLKNGMHYLSGMPIARGSSEEAWILQNGSNIQDMPQFWDNVNEVAHFTMTETWSVPNAPKKQTYIHFIYDHEIARTAKTSLNNLITSVLDTLNKGEQVDAQAMSAARPYLKQVNDPNSNPHMKPKKRWIFDQASIERHHKRAGFYVLKSDVVSDPVVAVTLYRMRAIIEQGFDQLKHQVNGNRLRVRESSHRGKLFMFLLATSLRMSIRFNADHHKMLAPNSRVAIPGNSLDKLFARLNRIKIRRHNQESKWLVDLLPRSVRDMLAVLFKAGCPPKELP